MAYLLHLVMIGSELVYLSIITQVDSFCIYGNKKALQRQVFARLMIAEHDTPQHKDFAAENTDFELMNRREVAPTLGRLNSVPIREIRG